MWLLTSLGFFSVVVNQRDPEHLVVRARRREDLEALRQSHLPARDIIEGAGTDYPFRVFATRAEMERAASALVHGIDYGNFKESVADRQGYERVHAYSKVWSILRRLETDGV